MNIGKYVQALTASNSDMDLNPLIRLNLATTRTWNDRRRAGGPNGDYVPQCDLLNPAVNGECGAMDNQNFGKEFFTRTFDPAFINGFGARPNNWEMGVSLQQEVAPRVGVTVGYYRRWYGNFYTLDNTLTPRPTTHNSVFRSPWIRGSQVAGVAPLAACITSFPTRSARTVPVQQLSSESGEPTENWHGVDFGVNARLRNGFTGRPARARDARFRTTARSGRSCRKPIPVFPTITVHPPVSLRGRPRRRGTDQAVSCRSSSRS